MEVRLGDSYVFLTPHGNDDTANAFIRNGVDSATEKFCKEGIQKYPSTSFCHDIPTNTEVRTDSTSNCELDTGDGATISNKVVHNPYMAQSDVPCMFQVPNESIKAITLSSRTVRKAAKEAKSKILQVVDNLVQTVKNPSSEDQVPNTSYSAHGTTITVEDSTLMKPGIETVTSPILQNIPCLAYEQMKSLVADEVVTYTSGNEFRLDATNLVANTVVQRVHAKLCQLNNCNQELCDFTKQIPHDLIVEHVCKKFGELYPEATDPNLPTAMETDPEPITIDEILRDLTDNEWEQSNHVLQTNPVILGRTAYTFPPEMKDFNIFETATQLVVQMRRDEKTELSIAISVAKEAVNRIFTDEEKRNCSQRRQKLRGTQNFSMPFDPIKKELVYCFTAFIMNNPGKTHMDFLAALHNEDATVRMDTQMRKDLHTPVFTKHAQTIRNQTKTGKQNMSSGESSSTTLPQ